MVNKALIIFVLSSLFVRCDNENYSIDDDKDHKNAKTISPGDSIVSIQREYRNEVSLFLKSTQWQLVEACRTEDITRCTSFIDTNITIEFSDSMIHYNNDSCRYILTLGTCRVLMTNCDFLPFENNTKKSRWFLSKHLNSFRLTKWVSDEDYGKSKPYNYLFIDSSVDINK
mgnify:FL=1